MQTFKAVGLAFLTAAFVLSLYLAVHLYGQSRFMQGAAAYERWLLDQSQCRKEQVYKTGPNGALEARGFAEQTNLSDLRYPLSL